MDLAISRLILEGNGVGVALGVALGVGLLVGVALGVVLGVGLGVAMGLGLGVIGVAVGPEVLLQPANVKTSNTAIKPTMNLFMITLPMT